MKTQAPLPCWFILSVLLGAVSHLGHALPHAARQVVDLYPGPNGSFASNITTFAGSMYFSAYTFNEGRELWKYNGTSVVLATNINETADDIGFGYLEGNDSIPDWLTEFRGSLYFSAFDPRRGGELWRYNGTNATRVADINPDFNDTIKFIQNSSWPNYLTVFNDALYFSANSGTERPDYELWKYNGVSVSLVTNIHAAFGSNFSSYPHLLTKFNNALYFVADDGVRGYELWKHTGTTTVLFADINPGPTGSFPENFTVWNNALYFAAYTDAEGVELWKTDGSAVSLVTNLNAGAANSSPEYLTAFNGALYFRATDGVNGHELWKYDGSRATLVSNINVAGESFPKNLTVLGQQLCFAADDGVHGWELWICSGDKVSMAANLNSAGDSFPENFIVNNGTLYFVATAPETGYELWSYDGASVTLVADINPGTGSSFPQFPGVYNRELCFRATEDGYSNWELWAVTPLPVRITRIARTGNAADISWTALGGTTNLLEFSDTVRGPFRPLSGPMLIQGPGETTTNYVDTGAVSAPRFYRVYQP